MIGVIFPVQAALAGQLVLAAMQRSVSASQVCGLPVSGLHIFAPSIIAVVDPPEAWGDDLIRWLTSSRGKLLIFGRMPARLAMRLRCVFGQWPESMSSAANSLPATPQESSESLATVRYTSLSDRLSVPAWARAFERFDFGDEWNNLGYGAIRADASIWAIREPLDVEESARLASVHIDGERRFSYAGLWDEDDVSILWFNRAVGPCDSFEWRIVENFLSSYRAEQIPCQPVLSEVPWGYDAAITSRLDCDEDIESARPLWNAYRKLGIPFSLAIHARYVGDAEHASIVRDMVTDGTVAILSHSATHAPNWGGSYDAALWEATESKRSIEAAIGKHVRYAVSPFHQSPKYALDALSDAGYAGCVGGIISSDPEFLMARGGAIAGMPDGFIGHSQQAMLHGSCLRSNGDPLAIYKQAFDFAFESRTLFGYLDHPFSARYQYGWPTEPMRIDAHEQLLAYISSRAGNPLFMSEEDALDFLRAKSLVRVVEVDGNFYTHLPFRSEGLTPLPLAIEFRGSVEVVSCLTQC